MNYPDVHQPSMSGPPGGQLSQYSYQQPPVMHSGHNGYPNPNSGTYPSHYTYGNGVSPTHSAGAHPASHGLPSQPMPLPAMPSGSPGAASSPSAQHYGGQPPPFDTTGQIAPPGMKPRVTATLWEDEGSLCFQVEAKGVCVARREDNHMINGTKLLNVAGMTRGRRDGILKSEKTRHVVKIGPMHLKGVWIPFERALEFANKEKITDALYPLFVHDIGALLYHPTNQSGGRTGAAMAAVDRRRSGEQQRYGVVGSQPPSLHQHSMNHSAGGHMSHQTHQMVSHHNSGRPSLDRAHTFPTPPTSASSMIGIGGGSTNFNEWPGAGVPTMHSSQPLSIDTSLSNNARSVPTTPATTPPGSIQNMHYHPSQQHYDTSRSVYNPMQHGQYGSQPSLVRYGQSVPSGPYAKTEMNAPTSRGPGGESEAAIDSKPPHGIEHHAAGHHGDDEGDHEHDSEYAQSNGHYGSRSSYTYGVGSTAAGLHSDHSHLSPEITGSPSHQTGSGRATPRTSNGHQQNWPSTYTTPQRGQSSGSYLQNVMSDPRGTNTNGAAEAYPPPSSIQSTTYTPQTYVANGTSGSGKRMREDDDEQDPYATPSGPDVDGRTDADGVKRRKTTREDSLGGAIHNGESGGAITGRPRATAYSKRH